MSSRSAMRLSLPRSTAERPQSSTKPASSTNPAPQAPSVAASPFMQRDGRRSMDSLFEIAELFINGALVGLMYTLIALGIVLVFKSSGIANLAQGAIAMLGAYLAWAALALLGLPIWVAAPLVTAAMFFVGRGIERIALRRMIGQPVIMVIMLTLGLDIL